MFRTPNRPPLSPEQKPLVNRELGYIIPIYIPISYTSVYKCVRVCLCVICVYICMYVCMHDNCLRTSGKLY